MEKGMKKYNFKFSIIIAVYNVEPFLEETIESIINQTLDFATNIQVILVDDGSTDKSGEICDKYSKKYPKNIVYIHKENAGVSSARNVGLEYASGEYINCLDGDDRLSENALGIVYDKFKEWEDMTDIVTIPLFFFDGQKGGHILNNKFSKGTRLINLQEEYDKPLFSLSASFVRSDVLKKYQFDERLSHAEDGKVVLQILLDKMCYGVIKEAKYWYRRRTVGQASAIQSSLTNKRWYNNYMSFFSLWSIQYYMSKVGIVPLFVQYTIMYDLQWRFRAELDPMDILTDEEYNDYFSTLKQVLRAIDDKIIIEQKQLYIDHKLYVLKIKHGHSPEIKYLDNDIIYQYNGYEVCKASSLITVLEFVDFSGDEVSIEGRMSIPGYTDQDDIKIWASINGKLIKCEIRRRDNILLSMGKNLSYVLGFKAQFIPDKKVISEIKFFCELNGMFVEKQKLSFGKFFPLTGTMWNSYFNSDKFLLRYAYNALYLHPYSKKLHIYREVSFLKALWSKKNKAAKKAFFMRIFHYIYMVFPHKEVWLISDRVNKADDNGEVLFEYIINHPELKVRPIFAISKKSKDYRRVKKIGRVIEFNGWFYKWYYLNGAKIVSSQGEDYIYRPFAEYSYCYADLIQKSKFIFLQHGIIKDDLSRWLKKTNKNIHIFVTSTIPEYNSVIEGNYGYTPKEVKLTGLPRHDKLYNDEKRCITIIPSWRAYLVGGVNPKTGKHTVLEKFNESMYKVMYSQLLTNKKLIESAKYWGYDICFMSHPNMSECTCLLDIDSGVKVIDNEEIIYRKVFAESDLIVTDYSSVVFDFAYLKKPVLYYQADKEEFFSGGHTYDKGYFNYERDGFGEVTYSVEKLVDLLIEYMKSGCKIKDKYLDRIKETFPFHDRNNCTRVCEEIINMNIIK